MLTLKGRFGLLSCVAVLGALAGCGGDGGSSPSNTAALRMKMAWPAPGRMVPNASNSVVAIVTVKGKEVARALFSRLGARSPLPSGGSSEILFQRLPAGEATVSLTAYPETDGTGVAQAKGVSTETLVKGQIVEDHATMASTVATLSIAPIASDFTPGDTSYVSDVTARDAAGAVVLLDTVYREKLRWISDASDKVAVSPYGSLTAVAPGTANLTVSMVVDDAGTTKTATTSVSVAALQSLLLAAESSSTGGQFVATGIYANGQTRDVTGLTAWSATAPGTITAGGLFSFQGNGPQISTVTGSLFGVSKTYEVNND